MPVLTPPDPVSVRTTVTLLDSAPPGILYGFQGVADMGVGPNGHLAVMRADQAATLIGSGWATAYVNPPSTGWAG